MTHAFLDDVCAVIATRVPIVAPVVQAWPFAFCERCGADTAAGQRECASCARRRREFELHAADPRR